MAERSYLLAKEFGPYAGPRLAKQGPHSGESLRRKLLTLWNSTTGPVTIDLDGMKGMGSSFLDEAFGKLVSKEGVPKDELQRRFSYRSRIDPSYIETIRNSIERAKAA